MNREFEYIHKYIPKEKWSTAEKRLKNGEPVQYIIGNVDFYGILLDVDQRVLIPRFETEELVYKTLIYIEKYFDGVLRIADIGTGSGAIAISLMKKRKNTIVDATDISSEALEVAISNAKKNNVQIQFYHGNLLDPLKEKYDILISNPPYIDKKERIMDIVYNNEPHIALFAKDHGLFYYEQILRRASLYVKKKNMIAFEIGETQGDHIKEMAKKYFKDSQVLVEKDMQGRDRFLFILNHVTF